MRTAVSWMMAASLIGLSATAVAQSRDPNVLGYHGGGSRSGLYIVPGLTVSRAATAHLDRSFDGRVPGHIYAQPLYWRPPGAAHGMLIVASENNIVQALDAQTGAELWRRNVGAVVPHSALPCGDISPLGVTGTPVIDGAKGIVYLDAFAYGTGAPQHNLFALSLRDGSTVPGYPQNVAKLLSQAGRSFDPTIQGQRGGLTLVGNTVLVPFGGHWGDCKAYHGWVVGFDTAAHKLAGAWVTRAEKGGIWGQGAVSFDGASAFATTGNTAGASAWGDGEAVIRLRPGLSHSADTHDFFAPTNWQTLDRDDADLGGTGPLPIDLPNGSAKQKVILALGKDGNAYVLDRTNLGGISTAPTVARVSTGEIITGPAAYPRSGGIAVAFQGAGANCPGLSNPSLVSIQLTAGSPPTLNAAWCASVNGQGSPIVTTSDGAADPIVWIVGAEGDERLHGFRGDNGQPVFAGGGAGDAVAGVRHFATIVAAEGRLYVAGDDRVHAFVFGP